jgi:asparagine synthase (glutamine-hydrolysing)
LHLYAVAADLPDLSGEIIAGELERLGDEYGLDPQTGWTATSRAGALTAAGMHHGANRAGPRRYLARSSSHVTFFDGLPVEGEGRFTGCDAEALDSRWDSLDGCLEGQFSAVRLDLEGERAELLLDTLGLAQVFFACHGRGTLVSNSATLITTLLDLRAPDPLGVSSFLGLGWAASDRTLTRGVKVLCGGARHVVERGAVRTHRAFGPQSIPQRTNERVTARELAARLTDLTANAVRDIERVGCALTAGRDTRVLTALLQATGARPLYFTGGVPTQPDVVIANEIAQRLDLRHEVVFHDPDKALLDWTDAAVRFVRQNDGLASLLQLGDYTNYIDLLVQAPTLGVKLWGVGGEIGRAGTGELTAIATNVPLLRSSIRMQRKLLRMKNRDEAGLMTTAAANELACYLDAFVSQRLAEGWLPAELQEAFYTFERVGRWGATGPRRMAGADDIFTPFCSRLFIDYCFSMSSRERYVEAAHYRLLTELSTTLRDHRYETPFHTQRSWLAPALATHQLAYAVRKRVGPGRRPTTEGGGETGIRPQYPFQHSWFEARLDLIRELFAESDSELWDWVSRPRVEALLNGTEADRACHQEALLRATTVSWHFNATRRDVISA